MTDFSNATEGFVRRVRAFSGGRFGVGAWRKGRMERDQKKPGRRVVPSPGETAPPAPRPRERRPFTRLLLADRASHEDRAGLFTRLTHNVTVTWHGGACSAGSSVDREQGSGTRRDKGLEGAPAASSWIVAGRREWGDLQASRWDSWAGGPRRDGQTRPGDSERCRTRWADALGGHPVPAAGGRSCALFRGAGKGIQPEVRTTAAEPFGQWGTLTNDPLHNP